MFNATTEFSLGHSLLSNSDIVDICKTHDLDKVVVTDTMRVTSHIPLTEKLGDKLALGVRLSLTERAEQERMPLYQPKVYPVDKTGIMALYKWLSKSYERPFFYEQPRLDFDSFFAMLEENPKGFLVSTGDINSILLLDDYKGFLTRVSDIIGPENLIYDIVPVPSPRFDRLNYRALSNYTEGNKVNVFFPALYKKEDADVFPIHFSISKNVEFNYLKPSHSLFYYDPANEVLFFGAMVERIEARYGFTLTRRLKRAKFDGLYKWEMQAPKLPKLSENPNKALRELAIAGLKSRTSSEIYGFMPSNEAVVVDYVSRLKHELEIIERLGFADYFLMVYELTDWCRKQNIKIGPGRGSVGGSLIAFCLEITDVDPIRFGLMFERFINPTRLDLPDIDLDFMSTRRHEIVEHLNDRYGKENVCGIINYANLGSRSALRSTCRILNMPETEYQCTKLIPDQFGVSAKLEEAKEQVIDIKNFSLKYPDVWNKAKKLEGKLRNFSTHAAGIIVSNRPLINDAVLEMNKGNRVINWDKKLCEKQGLIKLDVLGLTTLDIIELTLRYIEKNHGETIDLHAIPLNDAKVLDSFAAGNTGGVFQFEGGSVKRLLKDLSKHEALTFEDLVAANALNRPGPIEAGLVQMYIDGKNGELHDVDHHSMTDILKDTFNVMVYQEQIMKVAVEFAGYSLPESDNLRKIMGKKLPEEMKKEADKFIDGAVAKHGVASELASRIFDQISKFAFYAFNKSHSVEYSLLSYICMFLKVNFPVEFYAASLTYIDDSKVRVVINEAKKNGILVTAPSINHSTDKFHPKDDNTIVAPLSKIKFVSSASNHIILERDTNGPFTSVENLEERTVKRLVNSRVVGAMKAVGALDEIIAASEPVCPVERSKALNDYLPSIPLGYVSIPRKMAPTHIDKKTLMDLFGKLADKLGDSYVSPFAGKNMQFMVVTDCASPSEGRSGVFTETKAFNSIRAALYKSGMDKADAYWTGLVKRPKNKSEKVFDNTVLEESFKILLQEIEILKPTVIVCLGSQAARMFDGTLKGNAADNSGKVLYDADLNCNIVFSINPSMLFFKPDLEHLLIETFEIVESLL